MFMINWLAESGWISPNRRLVQGSGLLLLALSGLLGACREDQPAIDLEAPAFLDGEIILPPGSWPEGTASAVWTSGTVAEVRTDGSFRIPFPGWHALVLLVDEGGEVVMMGHVLPGQRSIRISPASTALALAMATPAALSLTEGARTTFASDFVGVPAYHDLWQALADASPGDPSLLDPSNRSWIGPLTEAVLQAATTSSDGIRAARRVSMDLSATGLALSNPQQSFATGLEWTRNEGIDSTLVVLGADVRASTIWEALRGLGTAVSASDSVYLPIAEGDLLEMRGFRGHGLPWGTWQPAYQEAQRANVAHFCRNRYVRLAPRLDTVLCASTLHEGLLDLLGARFFSTEAELPEALDKAWASTIDGLGDLLSSCGGPSFHAPFFHALIPYYAQIRKPAFQLQTQLINDPLTVTWTHAEAFFDTCFRTENTVPVPCANWCNDGIVIDVDGNAYPIVSHRGVCWMGENLKTEHFRNGDPIPRIVGNGAWSSASGPALAVLDHNPANKDIYGLLYNGFAVRDYRGICPEGWRLPTRREFELLEEQTTYSSVIGGIKATGTLEAGTGLWASPNLGATNSTGFTALPGGLRHFNGVIGYSSFRAAWWMAPSGTDPIGRQSAYYILHDRVEAYTLDYPYVTGLSVRCVRDH